MFYFPSILLKDKSVRVSKWTGRTNASVATEGHHNQTDVEESLSKESSKCDISCKYIGMIQRNPPRYHIRTSITFVVEFT